jgi:small-conductance mechanosensitive channel
MNRNMLLTAILAALLANLAVTVTNTVITGRAEAQNAPAARTAQAGPLQRVSLEGEGRENLQQMLDDMHKLLNLMDQMNDRITTTINRADALAPQMNNQFQLLGGQFVRMNQTLSQILVELKRNPQ